MKTEEDLLCAECGETCGVAKGCRLYEKTGEPHLHCPGGLVWYGLCLRCEEKCLEIHRPAAKDGTWRWIERCDDALCGYCRALVWEGARTLATRPSVPWKKLTSDMRHEIEALCAGNPPRRSRYYHPPDVQAALEMLQVHGYVWFRNDEWLLTDAGRAVWQSRKKRGLSCMEVDCDEPAEGTGLFCLTHGAGASDPARRAPRTSWARQNRPDSFDRDDD